MSSSCTWEETLLLLPRNSLCIPILRYSIVLLLLYQVHLWSNEYLSHIKLEAGSIVIRRLQVQILALNWSIPELEKRRIVYFVSNLNVPGAPTVLIQRWLCCVSYTLFECLHCVLQGLQNTAVLSALELCSVMAEQDTGVSGIVWCWHRIMYKASLRTQNDNSI